MSEQEDVGPGHNHPPDEEENPLRKIDPEKLFDLTTLPLVFKLNYPLLYARKDELLKNIKGWIEDHTSDPKAKPLVGDEQDLKDTIDFVAQVENFLKKEVEVTRKRVKGPLDKAAAAVQQFFVKDLADGLDKALKPIVDAKSMALIAKEERERQRLREEAWEKAQLANRLAIQAKRALGVVEKESYLEHAMAVEDEARRLEAAAAGSTVELTRTRTDLQQIASLRVTWNYEVEDMTELLMAIVNHEIPFEWVTINETYANSQIKRKDGVRIVPGLKIVEEKTAR